MSFYPNAALWWEYSDNILLTPEESEDDKIADHSINARPGAALLFESLRTQARLGASMTFQWYLENEDENGVPDLAAFDAGIEHFVTPQTRLRASDTLAYFFDPRDTAGTQAQEVLSIRTASLSNVVNVGVDQTFSRLSEAHADYRFITNEFEDPALFDVVSHQFEASWSQRASERHTIVVFGRYTRNLYNHEFDFIRRLYDSSARMETDFPTQIDTEADFDTYVPGLGLDFQMTPTLTFSARSGMILPARWIGDREYQLDPIDWYQRLSAAHVWRILHTTVGYTRDLTPANGLQSAVLSQDYALGLQQVWTRRWQTGQEGGFNRAVQEGGSVDAWRQSVTVNFYALRWLGLGAGYQHFEQFVTFGGIESTTYTNRFLATLVIGPPNPNWIGFTM